MRTSILLSVVSAALLAGTSIVSAQNEPKQEPKAAPKVEMKSGAGAGQAKDQPKDQSKPNAAQKSEPAKKNETTGQGAQPPVGAQKSDPMNKDRTTGQGSKPDDKMAPPNAQQRQAPGSQPSQGAQAPSGSSSAGATVNLTTEQRTQIRQTVIQSRNAPKVANPTFSLSVGTVVPRTVTLVTVPTTLVSINSAWRGHRYFIVGDQIVIVDSNFRIVAVLTV